MRRAKLKFEAIEPITLTTILTIARHIFAGAVSRGFEAALITAPDVEAWGQEQGQDGHGLRVGSAGRSQVDTLRTWSALRTGRALRAL